jgi:hypothetical protein
MSHLFKNNNKIFYKIFTLSILIGILLLTYLGTQNYSSNKINYLSFSIISNFLILFAIRKNAIFFETFFSLLLWLGFWFKFTCTIVFTDGVFREGVGIFDYSKKSFDEVLFVAQIGLLSFIISGYFRQLFLFKYPEKLKLPNLKKNFFFFGRKKIWIFFVFLYIFIALLNFYFKIYQKGLLPTYDLNFILSGMFKWLLLFGLSAFSATLVFYEYSFYKKFFFMSVVIILFETFFTSFSMLSRGMIFNAIALLYGIYKFSKKIDTPNNYRYYLKSIVLIILLFYISVSSVNYLRANYFYVGKSVEFVLDKADKQTETQTEILKKLPTSKQINSEILFLIINRWVGVDGIMAVTSKKNILSLEFLFSSFKERPTKDTPTFYELTFGLEENIPTNELYENVKGNTLPGILAFLFYSGSYFVLFIGIFILSIIASSIEFLSFKLSSNNLIFSSLIGQVIAFRFIHFGYLPHQTYLLFGTIILTILFVYILGLYSKKNSSI